MLVFSALLLSCNYQVDEVQFITRGFTEGFPIGYEGDRHRTRIARNLQSGLEFPQVMWDIAMKEVKLGRFAGPYHEPPLANFWVNPLGLVEKKDTDEKRLIFHLSHPQGDSVNSGTPVHLTTTKYPDFQEAVKLCKALGKGCYVVKSDLKSAFRNLPINPQDYPLLGMKVRNPGDGQEYYFVDRNLPFGALISYSHFQRISNAIRAIFVNRYYKEVINYLDDFFFGGKTKDEVDWQVRKFIDLCKRIGMPVSMEKTFWGTQRISIFGSDN